MTSRGALNQIFEKPWKVAALLFVVYALARIVAYFLLQEFTGLIASLALIGILYFAVTSYTKETKTEFASSYLLKVSAIFAGLLLTAGTTIDWALTQETESIIFVAHFIKALVWFVVIFFVSRSLNNALLKREALRL